MANDGVPAPDALLARAGFVRALVRDLVRDEHEAADVEQEVYLQAMRHPRALDGSPAAWLTVVARRVAAKLRRERGRRRRREQAVARRERTESTANAAARLELHHLLVERVRRLPEAARSVVVMRYFDGLKPAEIARRLDMPVATVKTRLQRALARLRVDMDRSHRGGRRAWCALALPWAARPRSFWMGGLMAAATTKTALVAATLLVVGTLVAIGMTREKPERKARTRAASDLPAQTERDPIRKPEVVPEPVAAIDLQACDRNLDVHGVVVRRSGLPVAGARIEAVTYPWRRVFTGSWDRVDDAVSGPRTKSASDGSFSIRLAWGQAVALRVSAKGFAVRELAQVSAGERVRIVLDGGAKLVVESSHSGIGVRVFERGGYPWAYGDEQHGTTDSEGRVEFEGLTGIVFVQLLVAPSAYTVQMPAEGTKTLKISLDPAQTFVGRVLDATTNQPVPDAKVRLARTRVGHVTTDGEGRYELAIHLNGWRAGVTATAPGYAVGHAALGDDIALSRGVQTRGRVLAVDGAPVGGARVVAVRHPHVSRSTVSYPDGRFELAGLTDGAWHTLVVMKPGRPRTLIDFVPGDLGDLELGEPGVVEGRVLAASGEPAAGIVVRLVGSGYGRDRLGRRTDAAGAEFGTVEMRITDDLGRFRFLDQPDGMHRLSARRADGQVATALVQVHEGTRHTKTDLQFSDATHYVVSVRDPAGNAVARVPVWVHPWAGGKRVELHTDERGEARLPLAGRANFVGVRWVPAPYLLPEHQPAPQGQREFVFTLKTGAVVAGRVLHNGRPFVGRVGIIAVSGKREFRGRVVDGKFSLLVPPGQTVDLRLTGAVMTGSARAVTPGTTDVELKAEQIVTDRTLTVRVVSPAGQPLAGVEVVVATAKVRTDVAGQAVFRDLASTSVKIALASGDDWFERRWVGPVVAEVVPSGQTVELRLRDAVELSGQLEGFDAVKIVHVFAGDHQIHSARPDDKGRFVLLVPRGASGPYTVRVVYRASTGMYWSQVEEVSDARALVRIVKK